MTFPPNARDIAIASVIPIDAQLAMPFAAVIEFLQQDPEYVVASKAKARPTGSQPHIQMMAESFAKGRVPRLPSVSETVPDDAVKILLEKHYNITPSNTPIAIKYHRDAMGAENAIGHMLEHYINEVASNYGWVWCSGNTVKTIDFIKPRHGHPKKYEHLLQVKNRYNSENSSSAAIRDGTPVKKWHRTEKKGGTGWSHFPDPEVAKHLSEDGFRDHIHKYLTIAQISQPN